MDEYGDVSKGPEGWAILRLLWPLFGVSWLKIIAILISVFVLIGSMIGALSVYEYQLVSSLAAHQAHIKIESISDRESDMRLDGWKEEVISVLPDAAITKFIEQKLFMNWSAGIVFAGQDDAMDYSKQSMIETQILGIEKSIPSIIDVTLSRSYTTGQFRFRMTPLEQVYHWFNDEKTVIPNKVMDNSFYPPISQSVMIKTTLNSKEFRYLVNQPFADFKEFPVLYLDYRSAQSLLFEQGQGSGLLLKLKDANRVFEAIEKLKTELDKNTLSQLRIESWLDAAKKQQQLLTLLKVIVFMLSAIIAMLGIFIVFLTQYRAVVARQHALGILLKLGLRPKNALFLCLLVCAFVACAVGYFGVLEMLPVVGKYFDYEVSMGSIAPSLISWFAGIYILFAFSSERTVSLALKEGLISS